MVVRVHAGTTLLALAALALAGCDSSSTSPATSSPSLAAGQPSASAGSPPASAQNGAVAVVDQYWKALEAGDCNTAFGLTVSPAKEKLIAPANLCKSIQLSSITSHQIGEVTDQTATSAKVKVTVARGGANPYPISRAVVVMVAGAWKISDFLTS